MKTLPILFLLISISIFSQERYYTFSNLRGLEDKNGTAHLFYKLNSPFSINGGYFTENSLHHLNLETGTDSLYLFSVIADSVDFVAYTETLSDYQFIENDPDKYMALYTICGFDCEAKFVTRDTTVTIAIIGGAGRELEISPFNSDIVYAGAPFLAKSKDGGKTWELSSNEVEFLSFNPKEENSFFALQQFHYLAKTKDDGKSFSLVDSSKLESISAMMFDTKNNIIYKVDKSWGMYRLSVSNNGGEAYSWEVKYTSSNPIYASLDTVTDRIYWTDGRIIFKSSDHLNSYYLHKELNKKVLGIYKKPGTAKLYAITKYQLLEIENDQVKVIKQLKLNPTLFDHYPLAVGNQWVYKWSDWFFPNYEEGYTVTVIEKDTIMSNGLKYSKIIHPPVWSYYPSFERIDSLSGTILRYLDTSEVVIDDLTTDIGDTVMSYIRFRPEQFGFVQRWEDREFNSAWSNKLIKSMVFGYDYLEGFEYQFTPGYGLTQIIHGYDSGTLTFRLQGCVINGILYGDTTVVGIEDGENIPTIFALSQNFPNPFNPSTKIKYSIPSGENGIITLKVYDILGKEIATLVNEEKPAGNYEVTFDAEQLSSGVYFYTLNAGKMHLTKKMIYLR